MLIDILAWEVLGECLALAAQGSPPNFSCSHIGGFPLFVSTSAPFRIHIVKILLPTTYYSIFKYNHQNVCDSNLGAVGQHIVQAGTRHPCPLLADSFSTFHLCSFHTGNLGGRELFLVGCLQSCFELSVPVRIRMQGKRPCEGVGNCQERASSTR